MISTILLISLGVVNSQGTPALLSPAVMGSSPFTPLFEDGFEDHSPMEIAFNGSLPLDAPDRPLGWGQMDVDAILNVNEDHPDGIIWGRSGIWIVEDPAKAHQGEKSVKLWLGNWTGGYTEEQALSYWGSKTVYCLMMRRWQELPQLYVRWYMKFDSLPNNNWEYVTLFYLLGMRYTETKIGTYEISSEINIANTGDGYSIGMSKLWGADSVSVPYDLTLNKWYCFEVWFKSGETEGEYKLWLDGEELISLTHLDATPTTEGLTLPTGFDLGLKHRSNTINNVTAWMDDVVVADYRVGPLNWPLPSVDVKIQVLNEFEGTPVHNASVNLGSLVALTDESGLANFNNVEGFTSYTLNISRFKYKPKISSIGIYDEDLNVSIPMEPIPEGKGCLQVQAYKENNSINAVVSFLGNKSDELYVTPFTTNIKRGPQDIIARYGDQIINKTVDVVEGQIVTIDVKFPTLNGTVEIHSYRELEEVVSTVEISHNNNSITKIVETPISAELTPQTYQLNVFYANRTILKNITVEEGQKLTLTFYFEPEVKREDGYIARAREIGMIAIPVAMILGIVIFFKIR